jgi:hypothetical protein
MYKTHSQLENIPRPIIWSSDTVDVPLVGDTIDLNCNGFKTAIVNGYFTDYGFLGVVCELNESPEWFTKQKKNPDTVHFFGCDITSERA